MLRYDYGSKTLDVRVSSYTSCFPVATFKIASHAVCTVQVQDQSARVPAPGPDGPRRQEPHARRHCRHHRHHGCRLRGD